MSERRKSKRAGAVRSKTKKAAPKSVPDNRPQAGDEVGSDGRVVLQIRVRPGLRREVKRLADEAGVTAQTYVLLALRDYGVEVTEKDLVDLRKGEHRALRSGSRTASGNANRSDPSRAIRDLVAAVGGSLESGVRMPVAGLGGGLTLIINNHVAKPDP